MVIVKTVLLLTQQIVFCKIIIQSYVQQFSNIFAGMSVLILVCSQWQFRYLFGHSNQYYSTLAI